MPTYFGLAIAEDMFTGATRIELHAIELEELQALLITRKIVSCFKPKHKSLLVAMRERWGIKVNISVAPLHVHLGLGDSIIVMSAPGSTWLTNGHVYSQQMFERTTFVFSLWTVID